MKSKDLKESKKIAESLQLLYQTRFIYYVYAVKLLNKNKLSDLQTKSYKKTHTILSLPISLYEK